MNSTTKKSTEEYITYLYTKSNASIPLSKKRDKVKDDQISIPTVHNYHILTRYNYNLSQLKQFAKQYQLKVTGNKPQLLSRIYCYLQLSSCIITIQKVFRGYLVKRYKQLRGPAIKDRLLCNNHDDFVTMEPVEEISFHQFISYNDADGFIYGFDIASLYNLFFKTKPHIQNPYNRAPIPRYVFKHISSLIRISKMIYQPIQVRFENIMDNVSLDKLVEFKTVKLFQQIDALGNYSNPEWFLSLNLYQVRKLVKELFDIWHYRAKLTPETKCNICPPHGKPFREISIQFLNTEQDIWKMKNVILVILDKFVNSGIDTDNKILGAYYVLGALTLVNLDAATSLPWLYESLN